jgi:anti-sigma regulatory factor (Ser/Thr protein kinase)
MKNRRSGQVTGMACTSEREVFPPNAESVAAARRFVLSALGGSSSIDDEMLLQSASLVTSELAANAVIHARTDYEVAVDVAADDQVHISVADTSPSLPVLRPPSPYSLGGRGLLLVDELSSSWGTERGPAGKRVWAQLAADAGAWWAG